MRVLDLFCGRKGFSQAFSDRGHNVTTIDINPKFKPTVCADITHIPLVNVSHKWDVVIASPVCTEFTKSILPWFNKITPSMKMVMSTWRLIKAIKPKYWVIENVKGAAKWLNPTLRHYRQRAGSRYLWGNFPMFLANHDACYGKEKLGHCKNASELKSKIPYVISKGLCTAIERRL